MSHSPTLPADDARPCVLNVGRLPPALVTALARDYALIDLPAAARADDDGSLESRDAALGAIAPRVVGLVTSSPVGVDAALLARLPALQVISNFGVGLDRIDLAAAAARGIPVGYTPDVLNDCVADLAFALMLDVARRVSESDRYVRRGEWPARGAFPLGRRVSGAKLGIVGLGRIGRTIAHRASGFDMSVRYHSRRPVADVPWRHEPALRALAEWADFLVVITAGGADTRHLVDRPVLEALGPDGCLINVARGSVVDEDALIACLQQGRLGGAGLDVYAHEPEVPAALRALDSVVLTPHTGSATRETRAAMMQRVRDNLASYFERGELVSAAPPA